MTAAALAGVAVVLVGLALRSATRSMRRPSIGGPTPNDLFLAGLLAPTGRHHAGVTGEWRPAHRADRGPAYSGRHFPSAIAKTLCRPARNLLDDTSMMTSADLVDALAG